MKLNGKVWLFGDDINTDIIFPHSAFGLPLEKQVKLVFSANRPGWADEVKPGDIIVGGRNFGTGSSRPGAHLLKHLQIGALVADSINGLFFRNCVNYGLPVLQCQGVHDAFVEGDIAEIDLEAGTVINQRTGRVLKGIKLPSALVDLISAGGLIPLLKKEGYLVAGTLS